MKTLPALPLALPAPRNRCVAKTPPPLDRPIWLIANVAYTVGCFHQTVPFEGRAEWSQQSQEWLTNHARQAIRDDYDAELIILDWQELEDRAKGCDPSDTVVDAHVYFHRCREATGFYAYFEVWHSGTCFKIVKREAGPFQKQSEATAALAGMVFHHAEGQASGEIVREVMQRFETQGAAA